MEQILLSDGDRGGGLGADGKKNRFKNYARGKYGTLERKARSLCEVSNVEFA